MSLKKLEFNKEEIINSQPLINPLIHWKKNEKGEIMITLPRRSDITGKIISLFFLLPKEKILVLDEIGSELFCLISQNKKLKIKEIIKYLQKKYLLNYMEAQASTLEYLKKLSEKGIILLEVEKNE